MTDYKLVPVEPTREMVEAAEDAHMPFGDMDLAIRMALLAAPAVQGEPVAWSGWGCQYPGKMPRLYGERRIAELNCDWENGDQLLHFTATPQPAPHPDDAAVDRFAAAMKAKLNKKRQEGRGGWQSMTAEQLSALLHEHVRKGDPVDVANLAMMLHQNGQRIEQQPAPDVTQLVEAAQDLADACRRKIYPQPDKPDSAWAKLKDLDSALAAYRKGGE